MGQTPGAVPELPPHILTILSHFLQDRLKTAGAKGYILGLSGGLDSAVVAALCARAVGPENVLALSMPVRDVPSTDLATDWAKDLGIDFELLFLDDLYKKTELTLKSNLDAGERRSGKTSIKLKEQALANALARLRMVALYTIGQQRGYLVVGTSNKSELMLGYFTKWGDGASDVAPIGDLYKTQVRQLAKELKVPRAILETPPTAELVPGQTDELDLGMSYKDLDRILWGMEQKLSPSSIARRTGLPLSEVQRIRTIRQRTVHKRKLPQIPKLGLRTVGLDWREVVR